MTDKTQIALYGGSFDPFHSGHEAVLRWLTSKCPVGLHHVWVLPTVDHAFNKNLTPYVAREAMIAAVINTLPTKSIFSTSSVPGQRDAIKIVRREERYTVETLEALHREFPNYEFHLVLGMDIMGETALWERWDDVVKLATPLVVARKGHYDEAICPFPVHQIDAPEVSSSDIRERLSRGDLTYLMGEGADIPANVLQHIKIRELYGYKPVEHGPQKVSIEFVEFPLTAIKEKFAPGVAFSLVGPFSQLLDVSAYEKDTGSPAGPVPYFRFRVVRDTDVIRKLDRVIEAWMRHQTLARSKGEEFTEPKPQPMGPGVMYLKQGGEPIEGSVGDLISVVGDYVFFTADAAALTKGLFGSLFGF